ncbi:MAG: choice-of-anchor B family protein [bacterium]|nr:choice-of-anchor B family protein [bacterium]
MKKNLLSVLILLATSAFSFSQLPNQNTYLLKNLDSYSSYAALWGYTAPNGREYAILGCNSGTSFVDITDSANIHEVDFQTGLTSSWREMKVYSHYAYIVSEATNSKLQIVDLQYLPDSVRLVTTWSYTGYTKTHSISQDGPYLYLNGGNSAANGGVTIVDVSNPESPVKLGQWTSQYVHDCRVLNDTIWTANVYIGKVSVINATNKNSPQFVKDWQAYPTQVVSTHNVAFSPNRSHIYTTNEVSSPAGKMSIYNINDLNNITFVSNWQPTGITTSIVHNVETYGNYAVIAHYTSGIRIVDITNPAVPVEVAWYDTYPSSNSNSFNGCWAVYKFPSGKIIASDISNGLFVVKSNLFNSIKLNVKISMEGLYNTVSDKLQRKDTVSIYLRETSSPYAVKDSAKGRIDSVSFSNQFNFYKASGGSYYIVAKHFNSIDTWSKTGSAALSKDGTINNYDFTNAASQAYGNNMMMKGSKFCIYTGDVDRSGFVDISDMLLIFNEAFVFAKGNYLPADLNADGFVDSSDLLLCSNNSVNFVGVIAP